VIRVLVVAKSESEEGELAELIAEDERMQVVESDPDVVLAAGTAVSFNAPAVVLGEGPDDYGHSVRAYLPPDAAAAEILASLDRSRLRHLVAAHLSQQNNLPELAQAAMASVLGAAATEVVVASQTDGFEWLSL